MPISTEDECECLATEDGSYDDRTFKLLLIKLLCEIAGHLSTIATNTTPEPPP